MTIDPWGSIRRYTSDKGDKHKYATYECVYCTNATLNASEVCDECRGDDIAPDMTKIHGNCIVETDQSLGEYDSGAPSDDE